MKYLISLLFVLIGLPCHGAMLFDDPGDQLEKLQPTEVLPYSPVVRISASFWILRTTTNYAGLCCKNIHNQGGGEGNHTIAISHQLTFLYQSAADASQQIYTTTANTVNTSNVWTHIAFSYSYGTAGSATFYVNGRPVAGSWTTGTGGVTPQTTSGGPWLVGNDNYSHFFLGEMTEVYFWRNNALNSQEVAVLADSRMKGAGLQLRQFSNALSAGTVYFPLNDFHPGFETTALTNSCGALGDYTFSSATPLGLANATAESVCSYYPNE